MEQLRRVLSQSSGIRLAVLFGSFARGRERPDSDLDIAITPDRDVSLRWELELQVELERACHRRVDLIRLDRASTLLRWHVARDGLLLAARPAVEWMRFRAAAAGEHADFAPALAVAARQYRQRLIAETPG